jgi:hypothetical protein
MLKASNDFYESWVNSLAHSDNVQNLNARCGAQGRGSNLIKGLRLGFHVRYLSPKPHKGFSGTLCKMLTTSRQYAEPFFGLPRTNIY